MATDELVTLLTALEVIVERFVLVLFAGLLVRSSTAFSMLSSSEEGDEPDDADDVDEVSEVAVSLFKLSVIF